MSNEVKNCADDYIEKQLFSGIEWRIEQAGELRLEGRSGYANYACKTPIPDRAIYRIYSMTKPIIAALAVLLVQKRLMRLSDPIAKYDPQFSKMRVLTPSGSLEPACRLITLEDLLTHRAGFSYEFNLGCHIAPYYRKAEILADGARDLREMIRTLAQLPLAFHPKERWLYSMSIDVLAHLVECVTGRRIDALLQEYIFDPLNMSDTGFRLSDAQLPRLMTNYGRYKLEAIAPLNKIEHVLEENDVARMYPEQSSEFRRGGIGLYATAQDYSAFARFLLTGNSDTGEKMISNDMVGLMRANRLPLSAVPLSISGQAFPGYGWNLLGRVMTDVGQAVVPTTLGEFGWSGAAQSYFWVDPQRQITGVIMTQFMGSNHPLHEDMLNAAYTTL